MIELFVKVSIIFDKLVKDRSENRFCIFFLRGVSGI